MNKNYKHYKWARLRTAMLLVWLSMLGAWNQANAQVSGTKTLPGDYATFAAFVTDINTNGIGAGGVTLNIADTHTETAPTGGYVITATGIAANPIVIQKSGAGSPIFTAATGGTATPGSAVQDGILALVGSDYVTIDGITFLENASNTTNPSTMEYGIAFFKTSATNGCQNNTIRNCIITLNRINNATGSGVSVEGSRGINVVNATNAAQTTALTITDALGSNSHNTFRGNTISNCNYGIVLNGFAATAGVGPTPAASTFFGDLNNDVGGTSALTGNIISNFGSTGATNPAGGIRANNQWSMNISFNNLDSNNGSGSNHANTLRGIFAQAGTSANVTISNNTISIKGGGTTSLLTGIDNGIGATAAANTIAITNNIIQNCTYSTGTTGNLIGINNSASAATVNINGNTFQNITYTGAVTTGLLNGIVNTGTNIVTVNNNTINNLSTASTGTCLAISVGSPTGAGSSADGNTVSNITRTSAGAGIQRAIIMTSPAVTPAITFNNNNINNITFSTVGSTGSIDGIYGFTSGVNITINNNTINTLSTAGGNIRGIVEFGVAGNKTVQNNTISGFSTVSGGAGGNTHTAISLSIGTVNVSRNKIYDISCAGALASTVGVTVSGGTGPQVISNNVIGNLTTPTATGTNANIGINLTNTTSNNVYYNTIYLNSTSSSVSTFGNSCITFASSPTSVDLRNNILINLSTPAQEGANTATNGQAVCLRRSATGTAGTIPTNYAATSNNNLYWCNPAAGTNNHLSYAEGVTTLTNPQNTFAQMKTFMATGGSSRDQLSVTENTAFVSTTGSNSNFLQPTSAATQAESGAAVIGGFTDAYNGTGIRTGYPLGGQVNGGGTAPDIGAYEGDYIQADLTGPTITYTLLGNTSSTANRSLTNVTVTDFSGVNGTTGTRPRIYYKRSTDANTFVDNTNATNGWKYVEAGGSVSPFSFTIDYSLLNGAVTSGTIVQYFVVAQDLVGTPNVGINSGVFAATPASVDLTSTAFPIGGTINQYTIAITYSGTINVGTSETITSLTNSGGLFERLNNGVLVGNLTVNITSDLTIETGAIALNAVTEEPAASNFSITIVPSGGAMRNISGSINSSALIKLNGVSRITINGLNTGGNGFTITNTSTTSPSVINVGSVGTTPISNITISNTTIINGVNASSALVVGDATTIGNAGYFTNITINGNNVQRAFAGIFVNAVVTAGNGNNTVVNGNLLNTSGANAIRNVGIYLQGVGSGTVNNNTIANFEAVNSEIDRGIWLATGTSGVVITSNTISNMTMTGTTNSPIGINITTGVTSSNVVISQNNISGITSAGSQASMGIQVSGATGGVTISRNTITNVKNTNTTGWGANGIRLASTLTTANIQIENNSISDVAAFGFNGSASTDNGYGIIIESGGGYRVYYNSINMNANQTLAGGLPAAFNVTSGVTTAASVDVRNNVFVNSQTAGNTERYAIFSGAANTVYSNINYNDYFTSTGPNLGFLTSSRANLAAWQTATAQDANSVNIDPTFTSATNLLPTNPALDAKGTPIAGITTDITGATRHATTPDVGAYEFSGCPAITITPAAGALPAATVGTAYNQTISQTGLPGTAAWSISVGSLPTGLSIAGATGIISGTPTATGTFNFTVQVTDGTCTQTQAYSIVVSCPTITFTNTTASNGVIGTAYNLDASVAGNTATITYSVLPALPAGLSLNTSTGAITGTPTAVTASATYTVTASQSAGVCTATQGYTFSVNCPTITVTPVAGALPAGTIGTAYNQTISQTGLPGTAAWSVSVGSLPTSLSLNTSTGAITGTPTATGTFNFTVQVTDGTCTQTQAYSIVVSCPTIVFSNTSASDGAVGTAYNLNAGVTGNTATITYSVLPALPAGLSLNTSTGAISGTPTAVTGSATYTVTASQSGGVCTVSQGYTFAINCAGITITPVAGALPAGTVGTAYNQTISQTGLPGTPAWSISAGTIPTGLSIAGATGIISGTPTATGTFNFTVQVTDGSCTSTQAYSIVVSCPTIVFSNASASNGTIGTAYNLNAGVTGNTATITYSVLPALPAGLTLDTGTGAISGTPTATAASATYTVTASQSGGACTVSQGYTFAVNCPTITFTNTTAANAIVGTAYNLNAGVTGNTATITYSVLPALPAGLSLNTSTGAISGTPTATAASTTYTVTASQSSGVCSVSQGYTFAVNCPGVSISPTTLPNGFLSTAYSQTLNQTGLSGTVTWSVSTGALPTGLSLNPSTGAITGTPTALGAFNFTIQAADGTCSTSQAYTVTINCVGVTVNPATLPNPSQLIAYSQTLTQTGLSGTITWSVSVGALPTGLSLNTSTGAITGTPSATGTFNFTIQATDGTCSATRAYTLVVAPSGPIIEITTTDIDFGDVLILQSARKTVTIKNIGAAPLSLSSMTMPNIVFDYGFIGTSPIMPNESRDYEVSLTPIAVASYSGTVTVNSNAVGGVNTFTVRGKGVNPTALNAGKDFTIKAYPNPTADRVNLTLENAWQGEYSVSVKDMLGREVLNQKANGISFQVDMTNLASGMYLVQVSHKNGTKTIQVVKK